MADPTTRIIPLVDPGLGNSAYLVDLGDGRALAVDPSLDLRQLDAAAAAHRLRVTAVAETHLHADFVTGATRLAARDGATVLASAAGQRAYPHVGLADEQEVDLGGLTLRALATPGHTGEHLSFLLLDGSTPLGVFTGGSLLVGAAARTDLVSPELTEPLARAQYASLQRLARLPDDLAVYPTHGAGSFCSAPPGSARTTTIGRERETNPLLRAPDADTFVTLLTNSLGTYPAYFARLGEVNRRGPALPDPSVSLPLLAPSDVTRWRANGAEVIDVRPPAGFAAGHLPGSLAITLRDAFATWLGWLVEDPDTPLLIVRDADQDPDEIGWQARKVGYDRLVGEVDLAAWAGSGGPLVTTPLADPARVEPGSVIDVRQTSEYAAGHLPAARNVELGALARTPLPDTPVVTMCGHAERATTAASLLERAGHAQVAILPVGPAEWAAATGTALATGAVS